MIGRTLNQKFTSYTTALPAYRKIFPNQETVLWLSADTGIDKDGSDNVNSWTDGLSANTKDFIATNTNDRPLWIENAINGYPGVYFNGKTTGIPKRLIQSSGYWSTSDFNNIIHMFFVAKVPVTPLPAAVNYWFGNTSTGTTTGQNFGIKPNTNAGLLADKFGYYKSPSAANVRMNSTNNAPLMQDLLVEMQVKGNQASSKIVVNASDEATATLVFQGTSFGTLFRLGSTTLSETPEVIISEFVILNQILSSDDLFNARTYFNQKYNLGMAL